MRRGVVQTRGETEGSVCRLPARQSWGCAGEEGREEPLKRRTGGQASRCRSTGRREATTTTREEEGKGKKEGKRLRAASATLPS